MDGKLVRRFAHLTRIMRKLFSGFAVAAVTLALVVACSGENSPADNCRDFLDLTSDCTTNAGKPVATNPAACDEPSIEEPRTQAQMVCAIQNPEAYCAVLTASLQGSTNAALLRDPAVIKLNACTVAYVAVEPCKAAVLALADCGASVGLAGVDTCTGQVATIAKCIVENKAGACSIYRPVERTQTTLTADEQAYQTCLQTASRPDAGRD